MDKLKPYFEKVKPHLHNAQEYAAIGINEGQKYVSLAQKQLNTHFNTLHGHAEPYLLQASETSGYSTESILLSFLLGGVLLLLSVYYFLFSSGGSRKLTGPRGLPIVGYLPFLGKHPQYTLRDLGKKYGNIFTVNFGFRKVVILNDFHAVKDAYIDHSDCFLNRPHSFVFNYVTQGKGLTASNGEFWQEQRRFALRTLRDLGMGKSKLQQLVIDEAEYLIKICESNQGEAWDPRDTLQTSVANVICSVVFGKRFDHSDSKFRGLLDQFHSFTAVLSTAGALSIAPWLRFIPGLPARKNYFVMKHVVAQALGFVGGLISEHVEEEKLQGKGSGDARDYIESYFQQRTALERTGKSTLRNYTDFNLTISVMNLFGAGTETSSMSMNWIILAYLHHPDLQEKVYQHIVENVGTNRPVSLDDRVNLPYLEAFIMEVQRLANVTPLSVMRECSHDCVIQGKLVKKGEWVIPNLFAVHTDPQIWPEPEQLKPERFLDNYGRLRKPEAWMPFSVGKRACIGESLARMELFIFIGNLTQRFKFLPPPGGYIPPYKVEETGISSRPKRFICKTIPRLASKAV